MILLILVISLIYLTYSIKNKNFKIPLFLILTLILFAGLRFKYGYDYDNYSTIFNEISTIKDVVNTVIEKGFALVILLFKKIGFGFQTFLLFIAFLSINCKIAVMKKMSVFPIVSFIIYFLIFYLYNDAEQIRHGVAIGFCFLAVYFLLENKRIIAWLLIFLAISMHYSAIFFIIVPFIYKIKMKKKSYFLILIGAILLSFINVFEIIDWINSNFLEISYLTTKLETYQGATSNVISLSLILRVVFISFYIYFAFDDKNEKETSFVNIYFLGIILFCLLTSIPVLAARSTVYMRYFEILLMPLYMKKYENMENRNLQKLFVSGYWMYYLFTFINAVLDPKYLIYHSI